ncbi:MAG: hypothetical protein ACPG52_01185 [Cognaticolwellia sp.]
MNKISLLATLCVGIFVGYIMAPVLTNENTASDLTQDNEISTINSPVNLATQTVEDVETIVTPVIGTPTEKLNFTSSEVKHTSDPTYQALEEKYQALRKSHQVSKNKVALLQRKLTALDTSDISIEQMEALVVDPFKGYMANFTGANRDKIYNFHQAEDDLDWGYNMQNYISDFIQTHYNMSDINLISVLCKQQMCELLVIQHTEGGWDKIVQDLRQQPWWQFQSTNSSSGNYPGSENSSAIYIFLS